MTGPHGRCVFNCLRQCSLASQSGPVRYLPTMVDGSTSPSTSLPTPQTLTLVSFSHLVGL